MGLESAEARLLKALSEHNVGGDLELRVVGGRSARRYAKQMNGRWIVGKPSRPPSRIWRSASLFHLFSVDVPPPPDGIPFVVTVHDLAGLRFADEAPFPNWLGDLVQRSSRVVTVSNFSAGEIHQELGVPLEKIDVIHNGPGLEVNPATPKLTSCELEGMGLRTPFIVRTGGYTTRKNVNALLSAWPRVHSETGAQLALVGPHRVRRDRLISEMDDPSGVVPLDYVPGTLLPRLLRSASALVSTSTYEGFGLPPLEAMVAGVPVVAIRSPTAEEVCGSAALLVDDHAEALAEGMITMLCDPTAARHYSQAGLARGGRFSWSAAAARHAALYETLLPTVAQSRRLG